MPLLIAVTAPLLLLGIIVVASGSEEIKWQPPILWSDSFGSQVEANGITSIANDDSNGYVCGYLNATTGTVGTPFLREYASNGGVVWTRTLPSSPSSVVSPLLLGVSADTNGIFLVGIIEGNTTLMKYDFSGTKSWAAQMGEAAGYPSLTTTSTKVFVAGRDLGLFANASSTFIPFLREYADNGTVIWTQTLSGSVASIDGLYADSSGVYVLADSYLMKYDLGGTKLWILAASGKALSGDSTGIYVSGSSLIKYDGNGIVAWNNTLEASDGSVIAETNVVAGSSGVYVSTNTGKGNEFITRYDSSGRLIWTTQIEPPPVRLVTNLTGRISAVSGGLYVGGSISIGQSDLAFVKEIAMSTALIFFGINSPWSWLVVGGLIAGTGLSTVILSRRYQRGLRSRPRSVSPTPHHKGSPRD